MKGHEGIINTIDGCGGLGIGGGAPEIVTGGRDGLCVYNTGHQWDKRYLVRCPYNCMQATVLGEKKGVLLERCRFIRGVLGEGFLVMYAGLRLSNPGVPNICTQAIQSENELDLQLLYHKHQSHSLPSALSPREG